MIDLHTHTTASDGQLSPAALVAAAASAGCETLAVTDHDTVAGVAAARDAAVDFGLTMVTGIEMTAVADGVDVHILGYCIDIDDPALARFLEAQRERRRSRVLAMGQRLADLGAAIDVAPILEVSADSGRSVGRPAVARALVAAGHAADVADAFERYLAEGRPAYLPRVGPGPGDVIARIHAAGGVAALAHPGKLVRDHLIAPMIDAALDAIEVYHPDHSVRDIVRYQALADRHDLVVTGGSDFHGAGSGRTDALGAVGLPPAAFNRLIARAGHVHSRR